MNISSSTRNLINQSRDYVAIVFGLFLLALGFAAFVIPERVVTGGVAGMATLIYFASHETINVAVSNYTINIIFLLIAFRTVGKKFVLRTIFGATLFSLMLGMMLEHFTEPLVSQQSFMNIIIGAVLCGMGLGLVFAHGGSSGGTDVLAAMVNKYSNISFGRMMLYCDLCIISSSYFILDDLGKVIFGYVFLVICSVTADWVINRRSQGVQFIIFSEKWQDIANAINNDARRGCTLLHGTGWYTKHDVKMLLVVCRKYESITIQRIVKAIDPEAFISMTNTTGVFGSGFDLMKVKLKKYTPKITDDTVDILSPENFIAPASAEQPQQPGSKQGATLQ